MKRTQILTKAAITFFAGAMLVLGLFCLQNSETRADPPRSKYPYLPIMTEISLFSVEGESPWIEFFNPLEEPVNASELKIVINDTLEYSFPEGLPPLPSKGFIILRLDGKGEKGEGFRNEGQTLVLHSSRVFTCAMKCIGQIAIYQKVAEGTTKLVGFVSWGAPGSKKSSTPERNIIWKPKWFVGIAQGPGDYDPGAIIKAGYSIGLYPGIGTTGVSDWVVFSRDDASRGRDDTSPGRENIVPRPALFTPSDGKVRYEDPSVRWVTNKYAKTYRFQIARDREFSSMVGDTTLSSPVYRPGSILSEGKYYYRVKTIDINGKMSAWSEKMKLYCIDRALKEEKILKGINHIYQRKDTMLLCLNGCDSDLDGSTKKPWDNCHDPKVNDSDHNDTNCAHASISMMVSYYGKSLSQDRIAYYMAEKVPCQDRIAYYMAEEKPCEGYGKPKNDLAHKKGLRYFSSDGGEETIALKWALGVIPGVTPFFLHASPTFTQLKEWLNAGRPIMTRCKECFLGINHVRVIDGYRVFFDSGVTKNEVHILDPLGSPTHRWEEFDKWDSKDEGTWVGPVRAPNAREDEESIWIDSDNDGIMDFDEQNRFFTDPFKKDSDNDGIDDKDEIRKYIFDRQNKYIKRYVADTDGDGVRKELDPDE